ncbi:MAG: DEAD/DEAH box helicase [Acidilobus sp.]
MLRGLGAEPGDLVEFALSHGAPPQEVSALVRSLRSCPNDPVRLSQLLAERGLYEDVVYLASRLRCPVSSEAVRASRAALLGLAEPKWEAEAAGLINERPKLDGSSSVMSVVCDKDFVEVNVDGVVTEVPPKGSGWRAPPRQELITRIAELSGARVILTWGCDLPGSVNVRRLAEVAFPDAWPTLPGLAHALGLGANIRPSVLVLEIARAAAFVLEGAGVDWAILPRELRGAKELVALIEPPPMPHPSGGVVVTDRPRALYRVWRPFSVDYDRAELNASPLTSASLRSLRARGGDVLRALRNAHALQHGEELSRAIMGSLIVNHEGPAQGDQVEPWDLECVRGGLEEVTFDCARPPRECLELPPPPDELELMAKLGVRCEGKRRSTSLTYSPPGKVRTAVVDLHGGASLSAIASAVAGAEEVVRRLLVVVSTHVLKPPIMRSLKRLAESEDAWAIRGGSLVLTLEELYSSPHLLQLADDVIVVLPERYRGVLNDELDGVESVVSLAKERTRWLTAIAITRAWSATEDDVEPVRLPTALVNVRLSPDELMEYARDVFRRLWGDDVELRPYQEDSLRPIFDMVTSGSPSLEFVILPTGAGKSAIFQVASVVLADLGFGPAVVISPLRALMHDQVRNARRRGLRASYVDSTVPDRKKDEVVQAALRGLLDLVYVTPEGASEGVAARLLEEGSLSLIVFDEAHALSRWGLSFRPSYLRLAEAIREQRQRSGWPPLLALSASAPRDVINDVMTALGFTEWDELRISLTHRRLEGVEFKGRPLVLRAPALRPEIEVDVIPAPPDEGRLNVLAKVVKELSDWATSTGRPWIGIVFVPFVESREVPWMNVDFVADYLSSRLGLRVARYHGRMGDAERRRVEEEVVRASRGEGGPNVIVATKAFGMGVDIPNVRWTVHLMPSESVEDLYQEIGRAGRDGRRARSIILYNPRDVNLRVSLAKSQSIRPSQVYSLLEDLRAASRIFSRGSPIPVPIGDDGVDIRGLDVLRLSGIIDYEIIDGPLTVDDSCESSGIVINAKGGVCLVIGDGDPAHLCFSESGASLTREGQCTKRWTYSGPVALVYPQRALKGEAPLPVDAFALSLWMSRREVKKVLDVKDVIEQALSVRSRAGRFAASEAIKRLIDVKLSEGYDVLREVPRLGEVVSCDSLAECADKAAKLVHDLVERLGETAVTVAAGPTAARAFVARYVKAFGRAPPVSTSAHSRLLRYLRTGQLERIVDMGYVVLITRMGRRTEEVIRLVKKYPYVAAYIYGSKKGRR